MRPATCLSMLFAAALTLAAPAAAQRWAGTWANTPHASLNPKASRPGPDLDDRTLRQVVRISTGGDRVRIRLTNELSPAPLTIGAITVAVADIGHAVDKRSIRRVTFAGKPGATIAPGALLTSDPIAFRVKPLTRLAVSIHFTGGATTATYHGHAAAGSWHGPGDQTAAASLTGTTSRILQRLVLSGIDVESRRPQRAVVAFGDSITDGARATTDADTRWPDVLAERLQQAGMGHVGVVNQGLGGNRILKDGTGTRALDRLDRDVFSTPGISHIIMLEGINDIGNADRATPPDPLTAEDLIAGYRQVIARAHTRGVKVILATILPYKGAPYYAERGEATRIAVNRWIRTNREADGMVDFDAVIADRADPQKMAAAYDGGDRLHPNDAAFRAMAAAIDLTLLR